MLPRRGNDIIWFTSSAAVKNQINRRATNKTCYRLRESFKRRNTGSKPQESVFVSVVAAGKEESAWRLDNCTQTRMAIE